MTKRHTHARTGGLSCTHVREMCRVVPRMARVVSEDGCFERLAETWDTWRKVNTLLLRAQGLRTCGVAFGRGEWPWTGADARTIARGGRTGG